jgi:hypothetical protein
MRTLESFGERQLVSADSRSTVLSSELFIRSSHAVSRLVAGETLVVAMKGEVASVYALNETAIEIWEALEKPRSLRELCELIERSYDIGLEKAEEEDVLLFVREMSSLGLVEVAVAPHMTMDLGVGKYMQIVGNTLSIARR